MKLEITRPDDLLNLRIEAVNLQLDVADPGQPVLTVSDAQQPAYLILTFPPQTIAEHAYFEAAIVPPGNESPRKDPDASNKAIETPDPPGQVKARLGHPSRLVFIVPAGARVPFSIEGLLDWSNLELSVNPIAAIGREPGGEEIANAPTIRQPAATETALELPYRLLISPNRNVVWAHRAAPFTARGRTELWHTRLMLKVKVREGETEVERAVELSRAQTAPLRAIWSPDYPNPQDDGLGRAAISSDDRRQLVILTSAFHGYEANVEITPALNQAIQPVIGERINAAGVSLRARLRLPAPYVPAPFEAEQLMLTPLGGWLRSRGHWNPPHKATPFFRSRLDLPGIFARLPQTQPQPPLRNFVEEASLFPGLFRRDSERDQDQLDLSEWIHVATQGRDHYVRIVYEGELIGTHHRAALIKVTERKFREAAGGIIGAYLYQRMFIVVRQPLKRYNDRANPFRSIRLTTLVTPDIAEPLIIKKTGRKKESEMTPAEAAHPTRRSFWVEVMTSATARDLFRFHAVGTDWDGNEVDFTIPLMFVSITDLADAAAMKLVVNEYNALPNLERRNAVVPGQKVSFAERGPAAGDGTRADNARLVAQTINYVVVGPDAVPKMLKAAVKIPQVEELLGTDAPTTIRYFKNYVDNGFDAGTEVFAEIARDDPAKYKPDDPFAGVAAHTLGVEFSSDKAGGFATPNLGVSTLTRRLGPVAGKVEDAVANKFDPAEFFKGVTARLFGSFDLFKLMPVASLDQNAPKLQTQTQDIPGGGKLLIATLDWEPAFLEPNKKLDLGAAAIEKDRNGVTRLVIHGHIEKPLKLDNLGAPLAEGVKFDFTGTLNDFQVSVLKSVFINFVEFSFRARSNQKPDVQVKLDPQTPIKFGGDLTFVEELRNAIPPNLFGKGPSLDITPTGIRAGFAFALPPIAVGVFALKDVSLGAALTLPFLDGKPVFDFNVSERAHPFLLTVAIFGGGGFFHLQLDTAGIKQLEASFEFGAAAALDIGVASGEVHIMAGIYFSMQRKDPGNKLVATLTGYLRLGGSLSVLGLIKISVEFNLSFTYDGDRDKAYGRATLTVQVEVLFFSKSVELTVERAFGGKSGDPTFGVLMDTPEAWEEYALAFA